MATIANLVIQIGANAAPVKVALDEANGLLRQFANATQQSMRTINKGLKSGAITNNAAGTAADVMLHSLNQKFAQGAGAVREQLFRGVLDPATAQKYAREAAASYNAGLLTGIAELRGRNLLPPEKLLEMQNSLKQAGLKGGKDFAVSLSDSLKANGDILVKAGEGLTKSLTLPLVAAGGFMAKVAGEAEIAAGRMSIVWGPMTKEIDSALDDLHKKIPATTTELRNMTAITSELLLPLGIVPDKVKQMSLDFVSLSKDLSILNNVSPERAMHALQSSLVGMTRPLKLLGVDITDMGIKLKAVELGLVSEGETLNETGKALAAYALVMQRASLVQSAAAKLQGTFLVQLRFVKRDAIEAGVAFGSALLPALLPLVKMFIQLLKAIGNISPESIKLILIFGLMVAAIGPVTIVIGKLMLAFSLLVKAIKLYQGGLLAAALISNPVVLAITAIVVVAGLMVLAFKSANKEMRELQGIANTLDKAQVQRETVRNADRMLRLENERNQLLKKKQTETITQYNPGLGTNVQTTRLTEAGKAVAELNDKMREGGKVMLALGNRFTEIANNERTAAEDLKHWTDKMKEFASRSETSFTKPKKSIDILRDAMSVLLDRLDLFRTLNLDITEPLSKVQIAYDIMVEKAGGLNNLHKEDADRLRIILQLQQAIAETKAEIAERPRVAASLALETVRNIREEAIDLVSIDVGLVERAFNDARSKLEALDKAIAPGGGLEKDRAAIRLSTQMHRLLSNMGDFVQTISDELIEITGVGQDLPWSSVHKGLTDLHDSLLEVGAKNAERFAALKSSFGFKVKTPEGDTVPGVDIAGGAMDLLKSAALGVAESFTPLGIIVMLIGKVLEPLMPAIEAFFLPLAMVAKVIGSSLIPVMRMLFPILKYFAIAVTYVAEILYKVSAFILRAIGSLVRGLGNLINKLPGSPGDPLVKAGQAMLDLADGYTQAAKDMKTTRDELRDMNFDDALASVNGLSKAAREASQNIPQIFKMARSVFDAANPATAVIRPVTVGNTPPVGSGSSPRPVGVSTTPPVVTNIMQFDSGAIQINGSNKTARQLFTEIEDEGLRRQRAETGERGYLVRS